MERANPLKLRVSEGEVVLYGLFLFGGEVEAAASINEAVVPLSLFIWSAKRFEIRHLEITEKIRYYKENILTRTPVRGVVNLKSDSLIPFYIRETEVPWLSRLIRESREKKQTWIWQST